jgi:hypothetical protein
VPVVVGGGIQRVRKERQRECVLARHYRARRPLKSPVSRGEDAAGRATCRFTGEKISVELHTGT